MDKEFSQNVDQENKATRVSRRRLLQLLAASGAVVGLELLLPGRWSSPQAAKAADPDVTPYPPGCLPADFPLKLHNTSALLIDNAVARWRVDFLYNDSLGQLSTDSSITAVHNTSNGDLLPIYKNAIFGLPSGPNGSLFETHSYSFTPDCLNSAQKIIGKIGRGSFYFNTSIAGGKVSPQAVAETNGSLIWSLSEPEDRSSEQQQTPLTITPTALTLEDLVVNKQDSTVTVAAAAGAAALGAMTLHALRNNKDQEAADGGS